MAVKKKSRKRNKKYQVNDRKLKANVKYKDTIFRMLYREK